MSKPLWKVMHRAHNDVGDPFGNAVRSAYAAEIRAVADAIPEQLYGASGVKAWLLQEADRAEKSDAK